VTTKLTPIEGQSIRIYEEYFSCLTKKHAQRRTGAKRGKRTGLATGYLLVDFRLRGYGGPGTFGGAGSLVTLEEGDDAGPMAHVTPHIDHLQWKCRRIARSELPDDWRKALFGMHAIVEKGGKLYDIEEETP
jgi:hypothetical protein